MSRTQQMEVLLKQYKEIKENKQLNNVSYPEAQWNVEKKGWEVPEDYKEQLAKYLEKSDEYNKAQEAVTTKIQKLFPIEIKNPKEIVACIVSTGYRGKFEGVEINNLTNLSLSVSKQMGTIYTNYKIDWEGYGTFDGKKQYKYRIQKVDGKIYLLYAQDYLDYYY